MISFRQFLTEISDKTLAAYIAGRINQKPLDLRKNRKGTPEEKREMVRRGSTMTAWGKLYKKVGQKKGDDMVRTAKKGLSLKEGNEEWRGPHEGKEFDLMMANQKPMALLIGGDGKYKKFEPHVKSGRFIQHDFKFHNGTPGTIVGQPGQEKNMARMAEIMTSTKRPHREIGRLLGYKEDHINKFVDERGE